MSDLCSELIRKIQNSFRGNITKGTVSNMENITRLHHTNSQCAHVLSTVGSPGPPISKERCSRMRNAGGKLNQDNQRCGRLLNSLALFCLVQTHRREIQMIQNHEIRSCMKMSKNLLFSISSNVRTRHA